MGGGGVVGVVDEEVVGAAVVAVVELEGEGVADGPPQEESSIVSATNTPATPPDRPPDAPPAATERREDDLDALTDR